MSALRAGIRSRTGIVLSETFINALLAFVTYALIVRITDLATVGLWALVSSVMAFARSVDVWSRGVSAFVAQARFKEGDGAAATYVSTAALAGAGGYALVTLLAAPLLWWGLAQVVDRDAERLLAEILPLMLISFWLNSVGGIYQLGFLGFERPGLKAIQTIGGSAIFLVGTLILAPIYGLAGMVVAQIMQGLAMLAFALTVFHLGMMRHRAFRLFDRSIVAELVGFGSKAIGLGAMQLLTEPILRLIANRFGGLEVVAVVDFASRLCQIPRLFVGAIGQTMVPAFARAASSSSIEQGTLFVKAKIMVVPLSTSMMAATVGGSYLVAWMIIEQTQIQPALITTIFAIGWLANLITSPEYFMLFGNRKLRTLTISHFTMVIGMLAIGFMGGELGGVLGAMMGAMLGVLASSVVLFYRAEKPWTENDIETPRFGHSVLLISLVLFVLASQLYLVAAALAPVWIAAIGGTLAATILVILLTPWHSLITIAGSIDDVGIKSPKK